MSDRISVVEDAREKYSPLVSDGSVSVMVDKTRKIPVKSLRDTGATQSLILKSSPACGSHSAKGGICGYTGCQL